MKILVLMLFGLNYDDDFDYLTTFSENHQYANNLGCMLCIWVRSLINFGKSVLFFGGLSNVQVPIGFDPGTLRLLHQFAHIFL